MKSLIFLSILFSSISSTSIFSQIQIIPADSLKQDLKNLLSIIETVHPDPYLNGGGKIAFHRLYQETFNKIPVEGMTQTDFYSLILPFIANVGDSHTGLLPISNSNQVDGLPFKFKTVERSLYIQSIPNRSFEKLLGAKLLSIENIPFEDLIERQANIRGAENYYTKLIFLQYLSFSNKAGICRLIPEWNSDNPLKISFQKCEGDTQSIEIDIPYTYTELISQPSKFELPSTEEADFSYCFLDNDKQTMLLVIKDMSKYREGFEDLKSASYSGIEQLAENVYKNYNSTPVPDDWDKLLEGIPSVTEVFVKMIEEIKINKTENLIIDLRDNTGGNSIMREILVYFLYGKAALNKLDNGYSIAKYSDMYISQYDNKLSDSIKNSIEISGTAYEFRNEQFYRLKEFNYDYEKTFKGMPTFWRTYSTGKYHSEYCNLSNVIVLSSPFTYSSGLNLMTGLYSMGAKIVGTPSGQAPNNFGDVLMYNLNNSGIRGFVSFKQNITFPDDDEKGKCLFPDILLTEEFYKNSNYDPNAEIKLAIDYLY
jgi:hypothetical protein